jgi:hypothetical protein
VIVVVAEHRISTVLSRGGDRYDYDLTAVDDPKAADEDEDEDAGACLIARAAR